MRQSFLSLQQQPEFSLHLSKAILFDIVIILFLTIINFIFLNSFVVIFSCVLFIIYQAIILAYCFKKFDKNQSIHYRWGVVATLFRYLQQKKHYQDEQQQISTKIIQRMQSALMALDEAVVLIDEQHCIEWWNTASEILLNLKDSDHRRPLLEVIKNPEVIEYFEDLDAYPSGIKIASTVTDGRFTQIKITSFGEDRRLLMAYDVTRIRNLEQMRKDFVDNISHELRTPLTVLSGYLENLSESDEMPVRWGRAFEQMQQQTRRMNALLHDLLLLSHLENKSLYNESQVIHMADLMNQLFDDAQSYNIEYAHSLSLNLDSHVDIIGSEMELASAFSNLITNAIKYTAPHGTITISWQNRGDEAVFSVQDTGIGIEPQHIHRLTERFYRVDSGRSRETGGTGLGLAIVKHVLAQHDAHLEIESEFQKGSVFKAVFPKHRLHTTSQINEQWEDTR